VAPARTYVSVQKFKSPLQSSPRGDWDTPFIVSGFDIPQSPLPHSRDTKHLITIDEVALCLILPDQLV
jgi:hypothetical protein